MRRNVHLYTSETLILIAVVGISSLGYGFIAPLRALYARSVGASSFDISLMMSAASLTGFLLTPLIGWLTDRVGSRLVLLLSLFLHGGLVLLYLPVQSPGGLILLRGLEGITIAGVFPPARAFLNLTAPAERLGEAMGLLSSARATGILLGPAVGSFLASAVGYNASFYISTGLLILGALVCLLFLSNNRISRSPQSAKMPILKGIWAKEFSLTYAIAVLTALSMGLGGSIWALYMQDRGASLIEIGLSYSTFAIPGMVFTPLIGRISDRHGRWHPLFYGLLLSGLVYLIYALPMSPWWIIIISTLEGLVVALARNAADGILADLVPPEKVGMIQANYSAMGTGGSFIGSIASGELYSFGPGIPFLALGAVFVASSSLLFIPGIRKMVPGKRILSLAEGM